MLADELGFWGGGRLEITPDEVIIHGRKQRSRRLWIGVYALAAVVFGGSAYMAELSEDLVEAAIYLGLLVGFIPLRLWFTTPYSKILPKATLSEASHTGDYVRFKISGSESFYVVVAESNKKAEVIASQIGQ